MPPPPPPPAATDGSCTLFRCVCRWRRVCSPRIPRVAPGRDYMCIPAGADDRPAWSLLVGFLADTGLRLHRFRVAPSGRILGRSNDALEILSRVDSDSATPICGADATLSPDGRSVCIFCRERPVDAKSTVVPTRVLKLQLDDKSMITQLPSLRLERLMRCRPITAAGGIWAAYFHLRPPSSCLLGMQRLDKKDGVDGRWVEVGTIEFPYEMEVIMKWGGSIFQGHAVVHDTILVSLQPAHLLFSFNCSTCIWNTITTITNNTTSSKITNNTTSSKNTSTGARSDNTSTGNTTTLDIWSFDNLNIGSSRKNISTGITTICKDTSSGSVVEKKKTSTRKTTSGKVTSTANATSGKDTSTDNTTRGKETSAGNTTRGKDTSAGNTTSCKDTTTGNDTSGKDISSVNTTSGKDTSSGNTTSSKGTSSRKNISTGSTTSGKDTSSGSVVEKKKTSTRKTTSGKVTSTANATSGKDTSTDNTTRGKDTSAGNTTRGKDTSAGNTTRSKDTSAGNTTSCKDTTTGNDTSGKDISSVNTTSGKDTSTGNTTSSKGTSTGNTTLSLGTSVSKYVPIRGRGVYVEEDDAIYFLQNSTIFAYKLYSRGQGQQLLVELKLPTKIDSVCPFHPDGFSLLTHLGGRVMCSVWISLACNCSCDNYHVIISTFRVKYCSGDIPNGIEILHSTCRQLDMLTCKPIVPTHEFCFLQEYQEYNHQNATAPSMLLEGTEDTTSSYAEDSYAMLPCCRKFLSKQPYPRCYVLQKPAFQITRDLYIVCQVDCRLIVYRTKIVAGRLMSDCNYNPLMLHADTNTIIGGDCYAIEQPSPRYLVVRSDGSIYAITYTPDDTFEVKLYPALCSYVRISRPDVCFAVVLKVGHCIVAVSHALEVYLFEPPISRTSGNKWTHCKTRCPYLVVNRRVDLSGYVVLDSDTFIVSDKETCRCFLLNLEVKEWKVIVPDDKCRTLLFHDPLVYGRQRLTGRSMYVGGYIYSCTTGGLVAYDFGDGLLDDRIDLQFSWCKKTWESERMCLDVVGAVDGAILFCVVQGEFFNRPRGQDVYITIVQVKTTRNIAGKLRPVSIDHVDIAKCFIPRQDMVVSTTGCFSV